MKKGIVLSLVMLATVGYIYLFEFSASQREKVETLKRDQIAGSEGLEKIIVEVKGQSAITFINNGSWWIDEPVIYPAEPGVMEQNLTVMRQVLADKNFPLQEDRFGFSDPRGTLKLYYQDGQEKVLILGALQAPGNKLYILNKDEKRVYVINNVWGQFFYKTLDEFLVKDIYINYRDIDKVHFKNEMDQNWELLKKNKKWVFTEDNKSTEPFKDPIGGLLRPLRKIKILKVLFKENEINIFSTLTLWKADGEKVELGFNKENTLISLPHLKVIAKVAPSSVRYFINEMRKAAEYGDKNPVSNKN